MRAQTAAEEIRQLVSHGKASSVSAFVKHAVGIALHDAAGWKDMLEGALIHVCARRSHQVVITSDAGDLRRIDAQLQLVEI